MLKQACSSLRANRGANPWLKALCDRAEHALRGCVHGDLPRWRTALQALPQVDCRVEADRSAPRLGETAPDAEALRETLMALHPWRKGPFELAGVMVDTEWRSDWKWERVSPHVDFRGMRILDIGCGNGYFGWRMLAAGARLVVGIDPTLVFVMQWLACRHFAGDEPNYVLPLSLEQVPAGPAGFDAVFSMGVLYHQRDVMRHLEQTKSLLGPNGVLVLESLVLPDNAHGPVLVPRSRYARMRNVWAIPTVDELRRWVLSAGYRSVNVADVTATTVQEQRTTGWMKFESLAQALDPLDARRTLEGYPAPTRAVIIARN